MKQTSEKENEMTERYTPLMQDLLNANKKNLAALSEKALKKFPLSPMMLALEELSDHSLAKLLAEVQKQSFLLGALAAYVSQDNKWRTVQ